MPFKKGQSGNSKGAPKKSEHAVKWDVIDKCLNKAGQTALDILDGKDKDFLELQDAKDRLEMKLKAMNAILKLAPQRHVGADGEGPIQVTWLK